MPVQKFLGVGLIKALSLVVFVWLVTVGAKVVFSKWRVPGISEIVHAV